jgi:hypothetical protein
VRLPAFPRRSTALSLQDQLRQRDREIAQLRSEASRTLTIGLVLGATIGVVTVIALLPDPKARIAEIRARLGGLDGPASYVEDARRLARRARESLEGRVRQARDEARQAQEEAKRELWSRFEAAKRDGHQRPEG